MIQELVNRFMARREQLKSVFAKKHPEDYKDVVYQVVKIVSDDDDWPRMDPDKITEIKSGSYQGCYVYLIPDASDNGEYWHVKVDYGSCTNCDTLESIQDGENEQPTARQVEAYLTLALHIIQALKPLDSETADDDVLSH